MLQIQNHKSLALSVALLIYFISSIFKPIPCLRNEWSMHVVCMKHECNLYLYIYQGSKGAFNTLMYSYTLHKTNISDFFHIFLVFLLSPDLPDVCKMLDTLSFLRFSFHIDFLFELCSNSYKMYVPKCNLASQ